jgi:hypothetical protein
VTRDPFFKALGLNRRLSKSDADALRRTVRLFVRSGGTFNAWTFDLFEAPTIILLEEEQNILRSEFAALIGAACQSPDAAAKIAEKADGGAAMMRLHLTRAARRIAAETEKP